MGRVRVVVIHNHQFRANIAKVDALYARRFSDLVHLVPFYSGDEPHVIPVYENSFHFQGYVAQGAKHFIDDDVDHYLFIADDLILSPAITEATFMNEFGLVKGSSFISEFIALDRLRSYWTRAEEALRWRLATRGVEARDELPPTQEAEERFRGHGLGGRAVSIRAVVHLMLPKVRLPRNRDSLIALLKHEKTVAVSWARTVRALVGLARRRPALSYPLVGAYSDIFVVSGDDIRAFSHYCGVFAATDLHVELAIPTALVLASRDLRTDKDLPRRGRALWGDEVSELDRYGASLRRLLDEFPSDYLFVHPVKLSRWDMTGVT